MQLNNTFVSVLTSFICPPGLIAIAAFILVHTQKLWVKIEPFLKFLPAVILLVGVVYGIRYRKGRIIYSFLLLAAVWWFFQFVPAQELYRHYLYTAIAVLLPLNFLLFAWIEDHGIFSPDGFVKMFLIAAQAVSIWAVWHYQVDSVFRVLYGIHLPTLIFSELNIPHSSVIMYGFATVMLFLTFLVSRGAVPSGFFWAVMLTFVALNEDERYLSFYLMAAGLAILVAVMEGSHFMAFRDELTDLPGRRALREAFWKMESPYTLALVNLDNFSDVNEEFGNNIGDQVLKIIAVKLAIVTGGGKAYRYAGDEFLIAFAGKPMKDVIPHLEALLSGIEDVEFVVRNPNRPNEDAVGVQMRGTGSKDRTLTVTACIGVAQQKNPNEREDAVMERAYNALAEAKKQGNKLVAIENE